MVGTKERKAVGGELREVSEDLIHGMKEQGSFQLASDEKLTRLISLWYLDAEKVCCCWVLPVEQIVTERRKQMRLKEGVDEEEGLQVGEKGNDSCGVSVKGEKKRYNKKLRW